AAELPGQPAGQLIRGAQTLRRLGQGFLVLQSGLGQPARLFEGTRFLLESLDGIAVGGLGRARGRGAQQQRYGKETSPGAGTVQAVHVSILLGVHDSRIEDRGLQSSILYPLSSILYPHFPCPVKVNAPQKSGCAPPRRSRRVLISDCCACWSATPLSSPAARL